MRLIDADALTAWMITELRANPNGVFNGLNGRQAANLIGKAIDEAQTVGGWISVKDRLPEQGNTCLVWLRGGGMTFMVFDGSRFIGGSAYSDDRITHWMLLPGAPEEVSGDA